MSEPIASPVELAERNAITAEYIQIELAKENPDLKQIDTWCWHIRQRTHGIIYALQMKEEQLVPDKSTTSLMAVEQYGKNRMAWYLHSAQLWSSIDYCPYCGEKLERKGGAGEMNETPEADTPLTERKEE